MKKLITIFCCVAAFAMTHCTSSETPASQNVLYPTYRPYTRWWWFAAEIDTTDVKYQLDWLKDNGFGGVEIAWIYPMDPSDTITKRPAWLSDQWAASVAFTKQYADRIGIGCDYTFGTLWPFNDIYVTDDEGSKNYFDTTSLANRTITWDHPKKGRVLNHLDRNAFANYADRMNKGLAEAYKGTKSGVFVDSWEVNTRYLWTKGFGDKFKTVYGYDIEPYMQQKTLYSEGNEDIFYDYMKLMSDYVLYDFYKPFTDNANKNGAYSRAQCGGAPTDLLTAFTLVDIPETEAILYEPNFSRIPASAAALTSKQAVSSETFTCAYSWTGWPGTSPYQKKEQIADLKLIADALFANGTTQIIWHGMPYNKQGDTTNHFYTTVHVGPDSQFLPQLKGFNNYMTKISEYLRKGKTYSDVAVYMPLEDAWIAVDYPDSLKMKWSWGEYELRHIWAPEQLKGRQPLWVNHKFLSTANYKNEKLECGDLKFSSLCIGVDYMDIDALKNVVRLAEQGLPIVLTKDVKQPGKNKSDEFAVLLDKLKSQKNVSPDYNNVIKNKALVEGENIPDFWCREADGEYFIFFANPKSQKLKYYLTYGQAFHNETITIPVTLNTNSKSIAQTLTFKPNQSLLLKINKAGEVENIDINLETPRI